MGTILIQYYEYLKLNFNDAEKTLKHLVVIEEAHRLFKNVKKQAKKDGPDMIGQLVETLSNIMDEIRAFGEGFIIVDQSPSKISPDVIKNSATKIIHRIDDGEDIKILQSGLLIPEDITSIPSLKQGEVLLRSEGMIKPCKIKINLSEIKEKTSLAESFNISNTVDSALSVKFAATSVLDNSELKGKTEALLIAFLLELGNNAADKWIEITDSFLVRVMVISKEYGKNLFIKKFDVILEMISFVIFNMGYGLSVKELGCMNMFVLRLLEMYYQNKNNSPIKDLEINIMQTYFKENLEEAIEKISAIEAEKYEDDYE